MTEYIPVPWQTIRDEPRPSKPLVRLEPRDERCLLCAIYPVYFQKACEEDRTCWRLEGEA